MEEFEIFLNDLKVGTFIQTNDNISVFKGNFYRQPLADENLENLLNSYIEFCLEMDKILRSGCDYGANDYFCAYKKDHLYLIDEAKWTVINSNQKIFNVIVPNFYSDNKIIFKKI